MISEGVERPVAHQQIHVLNVPNGTVINQNESPKSISTPQQACICPNTAYVLAESFPGMQHGISFA